MEMLKVLVVDDDQEDLKLIGDFLSAASRTIFSTFFASSIDEAKERLGEDVFDLVLLDYRMPSGTGLELISYLQLTYPGVPAVLITSHGDKELQIKALEAGAADYLEKGTFSPELLERTCQYAVGLAQKAQESGGGVPGIGVLTDQLVKLTRESVKAQTRNTQEIVELRRDFGDTVISLKEGLQRHDTAHDEILREIHHLSKFRWLLDWITKNPVTAVITFLCILLTLVLISVLIQFLDVDLSKVQNVKDGLGTLLPEVAP